MLGVSYNNLKRYIKYFFYGCIAGVRPSDWGPEKACTEYCVQVHTRPTRADPGSLLHPSTFYFFFLFYFIFIAFSHIYSPFYMPRVNYSN